MGGFLIGIYDIEIQTTIDLFEVKMRKRNFLNKRVSIEKLKEYLIDTDCDPEDCDEGSVVKINRQSAEIYLSEFECYATDRTGRNAYSLVIHLVNDHIYDVERVGHIHMCGGQGSDDVLSRFPHASLEKEAENIMKELLIEVTASKTKAIR